MESKNILGVRVDSTSYPDATHRVLTWASQAESRYVCHGVVASVMAARDSPAYRETLARADLVTPDGMPLVWLLRLLGIRGATRVYGPDLMSILLAKSAVAGTPVGFYGGTEAVLQRLVGTAQRRFAGLQIVFAESPPFRPPTPEEDRRTIEGIEASGARILFVGLGSPKQELWMHAHVGRINAVMLGVGAAFDFLAGAKPQAPRWMQSSGLEWLFRLITEPGRLWRRYLVGNPRFAVLALAQVLRTRFHEHRRTA
jgi:N-acetylglucosaminyldiphosphoundecaprenol N-acetyl-beta-D-mannosaminyltransferase